MPNIMLTYNCNLNCPYCFANELVKSSNANITLENYVLALDFIRKTIGNTLGLIGGEPLLHPEFSQMLEIACSASEISKVVVFTNGILLDRYADIFKSTKTHVLINCNSPEDIGVNNFNMLRSNIRYLSKDKGIRERLRLGVNLYSTTKDYSYIFELLDVDDLI